MGPGFVLGLFAHEIDEQEKNLRQIAREMLVFKTVECANPLRTKQDREELARMLDERIATCRAALIHLREVRGMVARQAMVKGGAC